MNPLTQEALASIIRWALALGAGYLVKAGIWTGVNAETYVAAGALAVVALAWSLWQKYGMRLKLVTALASPLHTTEAELDTKISGGKISLPSVSTPVDQVPKG